MILKFPNHKFEIPNNSKFQNHNGLNLFGLHSVTILGLFVICYLLFGVFLPGCTSTKEKPAEAAKVTRGNILAVIPSTGTVMPRNRLEIKASVAGRIEDVLVQEGDHVKKGQVLAWMSSEDRATLLDAARTKSKEELKYWESVYQPTSIVAPLNGFIIVRNVEPGQSVTVTDAPLVMADHLIVKAQVDETDLGKMKLGQNVEIVLDAYPDQKIPGVVEHIAYESTVVNNVTVYEVDVLPNSVPSFFRSGQSATVNFIQEEKQNTLLVPINAIRKKNNRSYVFVTDKDGKMTTKEITTGLENTDHIEVLSGLAEGDQIFIPTPTMVTKLMSNQRTPNFSPFGGGGGRGR